MLKDSGGIILPNEAVLVDGEDGAVTIGPLVAAQ